MKVSKAVKIAVPVVILLAGGIFLVAIGFSAGSVPKEFTDARLRGGLVSQHIVDTSNQISDELNKVNEMDQNGKFADALNSTVELIKKSQELRTQAVELSNELNNMTASISKVKSEEARQLAFESIADRLALINRLINYSDYLNQLLTALHSRFMGRVGDNSAQVQSLITEINAEVQEINKFNIHASQSMERFDKVAR